MKKTLCFLFALLLVFAFSTNDADAKTRKKTKKAVASSQERSAVVCSNVFYIGDFRYIIQKDNKSVDIDYQELRASWNRGTKPSLNGELNIPASVTYKGITYSVKGIWFGAFKDCTSLTSVTIPSSVIEIGEDAFRGCTSLTSVNIPNSVIKIDRNVFEGTRWFDNQPAGLVYAGNVAYKYKGIIPDGTSVVIKNGCVSISNEAFMGCKGLTSVTIPNSVTSIGHNAFDYCTGLTSVTIPNSVKEIGFSVFHGTPWFDNQPDGLVYAGNVAYEYKGEMPERASIVIKNGCVSISAFAFSGCTGLKSVTIPNSVTEIGVGAFEGCTDLSHVKIPNSVTRIKPQTFKHCSGLTSVTITSSVIEIESEAFYGCTGLTSLTIPNSVSSITWGAFYGCTNLRRVIKNGHRLNAKEIQDLIRR